jgi:molecular chaperone GrpE
VGKKKKSDSETVTDEASATGANEIPLGSTVKFALEVDEDFFADALASVEKREEEARQRSSETETEGFETEDGDVVLIFEEPTPARDPAAERKLGALRKDRDTLQSRLEFEQKNLAQERRRRELLEEDLRDTLLALQRAEAALRELRTAAKQLQRRVEQTKRRAERDVEQTKKFGQERLVNEILPVLDNLHLAMLQTRAGAELKQVLQGVELIQNSFHQALANIDVCRIDASEGTPFDPNFHEAMMRVPREDLPQMTILEEIRPGFLLHGRLLRAARVAVSSGGPAVAPHVDPETNSEDA